MYKEFIVGKKIIAKEYDPEEHLKNGEIDVTNIPQDEIFQDLFGDDIKKYCKKGKAYCWSHGPVTIAKQGIFKKLEAWEAGSRHFNTEQEMIDWMLENKGLLVYAGRINKISNKIILRYFSNREHDYCKLNFITYLFNHLAVWKTWKTWKKRS